MDTDESRGVLSAMVNDEGRVSHDEFALVAASNAPVISVDWEPEAERAVAEVVAAGGIVLCGETHGVVENVAALGALMAHFGIRDLALEWVASLGEAAFRFAHGETLDMAVVSANAFPDGRVTPGHFAVIRDLVRSGQLEHLDCFMPDDFWMDPADPSQNPWERAMAATLVARRRPGRPILVFVGGLHALTEPQILRGPHATKRGTALTKDPRFANVDVFTPMGAHVADTGVVVPIRLRYGTGQFYNFGVRNFSRTTTTPMTATRLASGSEGLHFDLPHATAAVALHDSR